MLLFLFVISLLANAIFVAIGVFVFKKIKMMAEIIFIFEDSLEELMLSHKESVIAMDELINSPLFVTSPEVANKIKRIVDSTRTARENTNQVVRLLEEVSAETSQRKTNKSDTAQ
jgi:hypothetical protein